MSFGWKARIQVILTLFLVLSASPVALQAQEATPIPEIDPPAVTVPEETPGSVGPVEAPADNGTAPQSETPAPPPVGAQQMAMAVVVFIPILCENDDRAGEIDFFPLEAQFATASSTSDNCAAAQADTDIFLVMISEETGEEIEIFGPQVTVPAGRYSLYAYINGAEGQSATITFGAENPTVVEVVAYFPDATPGGEIVEGFGTVQLEVIECANWERAGEIDFLQLASMSTASASTACVSGSTTGLSFSLVNVDDPSVILTPGIAGTAVISFAEVPSGTWTITETTSGISSGSLTVSNQQVVQFRVISYVEGPIDLYVEKIFCEDDGRAGTTDFTVDSPPMFATAASSTCFAVPPSGELPAATVTLDNQDTDDSYRVDLASGSAYLESITPGTYIATESIDGATVISDPFVIDVAGKRLRIINYIAEESGLPEPGVGFGTISGTILYCASPDRAEGDVDFIIRTESFASFASTSECEFGAGASGSMLTLYPVDAASGEPDTAAATPIWTDGISFWQDILPAGSYVMGYTLPFTGETSLSAHFTIAHRAETTVDINVFSQPAFTTYLDIGMEICVDPARAGQTSFQVITEQGGFQVMAAAEAEATATDCRYANAGDGERDLTLTNLDTGQSWTRTVAGGDYISFDNLLAGTYTLAETRDGVTSTSEAFVLEPSFGIWHWVRIRNFVDQKDWTEPEPGENTGWIGIFAYSCTNPDREGEIEWYRYPVVLASEIARAATSADASVPTASDTSDCITIGEADGIGFIATPVDGVGGPYEFFENGPGLFELQNFDGVPAGDYIITEVSTGATSGVVRVVYWTGFNFLMFDEQPTADVTLEIDSADPDAADTLPADATWSITSVADPTFTLSGTFPADDLELPLSIALDTPLPYGDYLVEINASPAFEPFSDVFTAGPPELASTHLFGLLQQDPGQVTWAIALQPVQQPEPSPTATVPSEPGETPTPAPAPTATTIPGETPEATATPESEVTGLPSTGQGASGIGSSGLLVLSTMMAMLAGAGAFLVRHKRT